MSLWRQNEGKGRMSGGVSFRHLSLCHIDAAGFGNAGRRVPNNSELRVFYASSQVAGQEANGICTTNDVRQLATKKMFSRSLA